MSVAFFVRLLAAATFAAAIAVTPASAKDKNLGSSGGITYMRDRVMLPATGADAVSRRVEVACPPGTKPSGGGAEIGGAAKRGTLSESFPAGKRAWYASAWHLNAHRTSLTVFSACVRASKISFATQYAPVGPAPASAGTTAECQSGHVSGGGVQVIGKRTEYLLNAMRPAVVNGFRSYLFRHDGDDQGGMIARAVCLGGKAPLVTDGVAVAIAEGQTKIARESCPGPHPALGGAAYIDGNEPDGHIVGSIPYDGSDRDTVPDDGWLARAISTDSGPTEVRAYAFCKA